MLNSRQGTFCTRDMLRLVMLSSTVIASGLVTPAFAQSGPGSIAPPPVRRVVDDNGVDVIRGTFNVRTPAIATGNGQTRLSFQSANLGQGPFLKQN